MRVKAKIKVTDIIIAWCEVDDQGFLTGDIETIDLVDNVEAEIIELMD